MCATALPCQQPALELMLPPNAHSRKFTAKAPEKMLLTLCYFSVLSCWSKTYNNEKTRARERSKTNAGLIYDSQSTYRNMENGKWPEKGIQMMRLFQDIFKHCESLRWFLCIGKANVHPWYVYMVLLSKTILDASDQFSTGLFTKPKNFIME